MKAKKTKDNLKKKNWSNFVAHLFVKWVREHALIQSQQQTKFFPLFLWSERGGSKRWRKRQTGEVNMLQERKLKV